MRVISADGVSIGHVWEVHFRDTEAAIGIRPHTFSNALLEVFALRIGTLLLQSQGVAKVHHADISLDLESRQVALARYARRYPTMSVRWLSR